MEQAGITAIMEEAMGKTGVSDEFFKDKPASLEGGYVHIPKRLRTMKHGNKAILLKAHPF